VKKDKSGYLWYLKAEGDTRARFTDYLEMAMIESVKGTPGSTLLIVNYLVLLVTLLVLKVYLLLLKTRGNKLLVLLVLMLLLI
jgi:hypothetical protein